MARRPKGDPVVKTLFGASDNKCAFLDPDNDDERCGEMLSSAGWKGVKGIICHIRGLNPGSARYDSSMTDKERNAFENLVLMCPNHSKRIDDLEPERFSRTALEEMKRQAEAAGERLRDQISDEQLSRRALALQIKSRAQRALARDLNPLDVARRASARVTDVAGRPFNQVPTIAIAVPSEEVGHSTLDQTRPSVDVGNYGASIQTDPRGAKWVVWACDHPETYESVVEEIERLVADGAIDLDDVAFHRPQA